MKILGLGLVGVLVLGVAGTASAGPNMRFGLTFAPTDQSAPNEHELGPMVAIGERLGPLTLEADYAYLSFMDTDTTQNGMQRLGVNLRADLFSNTSARCRMMMACTRRNALYVEGGVAERYGQWHLDAQTLSPSNTSHSREEHIGVGIELDNHLVPYRYGWQFGVRFAVAPHDDLMETCRGSTCSTGPQTGGQDKAVLIEWAFLIGS
jgi:hypothetical protein